jgi:hypothetical protein
MNIFLNQILDYGYSGDNIDSSPVQNPDRGQV